MLQEMCAFVNASCSETLTITDLIGEANQAHIHRICLCLDESVSHDRASRDAYSGASKSDACSCLLIDNLTLIFTFVTGRFILQSDITKVNI